MNYYPDNWVVLKLSTEYDTMYKVLAGWSGGYLDGDSWRINSGITCCEMYEDMFAFTAKQVHAIMYTKIHTGCQWQLPGFTTRLRKIMAMLS